MTALSLRMTALLCMFADHAGLALFPGTGVFRCIGRLAFPIYCFLVAQGYMHTRSLAGYARRLLMLALISEIPADYLIFITPVSPAEQNPLFALLLGLMAIYAADTLKDQPACVWIAVLSICVCAMAANVSYGWLGPVLCLCAYYGRRSRLHLCCAMGGALLLYAASLALSGVALGWALTSLCALFALLPPLFYNGRRGARIPGLTFLFYAAYPLHLIALALIRAMRLVPPYYLG